VTRTSDREWLVTADVESPIHELIDMKGHRELMHRVKESRAGHMLL
jgi:hypothetical protein